MQPMATYRRMQIEEYHAFFLSPSLTFSASVLLSSSLALTKELSDYRFFVRSISFLRNFWQRKCKYEICLFVLRSLCCRATWNGSILNLVNNKERKHTQIRMCLLVADAVNAVYISVTLRSKAFQS